MDIKKSHPHNLPQKKGTTKVISDWSKKGAAPLLPASDNGTLCSVVDIKKPPAGMLSDWGLLGVIGLA